MVESTFRVSIILKIQMPNCGLLPSHNCIFLLIQFPSALGIGILFICLILVFKSLAESFHTLTHSWRYVITSFSAGQSLWAAHPFPVSLVPSFLEAGPRSLTKQACDRHSLPWAFLGISLAFSPGALVSLPSSFSLLSQDGEGPLFVASKTWHI